MDTLIQWDDGVGDLTRDNAFREMNAILASLMMLRKDAPPIDFNVERKMIEKFFLYHFGRAPRNFNYTKFKLMEQHKQNVDGKITTLTFCNFLYNLSMKLEIKALLRDILPMERDGIWVL